VRVIDDGVGMGRSPSHPGADPPDAEEPESGAPEADTSLGMVLMKSLAEQLGGTLSFTHETGSTVHLSFPTRSLSESGE
jgi:two-component sensor histidine kinase